jgi:hypothetical protein
MVGLCPGPIPLKGLDLATGIAGVVASLSLDTHPPVVTNWHDDTMEYRFLRHHVIILEALDLMIGRSSNME